MICIQLCRFFRYRSTGVWTKVPGTVVQVPSCTTGITSTIAADAQRETGEVFMNFTVCVLMLDHMYELNLYWVTCGFFAIRHSQVCHSTQNSTTFQHYAAPDTWSSTCHRMYIIPSWALTREVEKRPNEVLQYSIYNKKGGILVVFARSRIPVKYTRVFAL